MHLVKRDFGQLQPGGARLLALANDDRERGQREELAGDDDVSALVAERLTEDALALAEAVDLGGVEKRDSELTRAPHDVTGSAAGVGVAVAPLARAELPGSESDAADLTQTFDFHKLHVPSLPRRERQ
jgi:hypothetical protein